MLVELNQRDLLSVQKEVLVEEISATAAFLSQRTPFSEPDKPEFSWCFEIRAEVYKSDPCEIDAVGIRKKLQEIHEKYKDLPRAY